MTTNAIQAPSDDLLTFLDLAQKTVGATYLPANYRDYLSSIDSYEALNAIEADSSHPLWWFLPPILYDMFDQKLKFDWFTQEDTSHFSLLVIPPPFESIVDDLQEEISRLGLETEKSTRTYSETFVGLLYGGYPWFESYLRIGQAHALFGRECITLKVHSDRCDVPDTLEKFKKRRRNTFGQSLQMAFDDLHYPGVLRPFHCPARIETRRHILAAEFSS